MEGTHTIRAIVLNVFIVRIVVYGLAANKLQMGVALASTKLP